MAVFIILLIAFLLRLPNLNESLWYDEVMYSTTQGVSTFQQLWHFAITNPAAPLYRVLLYFWNLGFGNNEIIVRIPSMVFGLLSVLLTYEIAKKFGSGIMPVLVSLLLSLSPVHVWYSQEATPYSMTLCLLLATVLTCIRIHKEDEGWRNAIYAVLLLTTIFTHYLAAAFLVPLSISAIFMKKPARNRILAINLLIAWLLVAVYASKHSTGSLLIGMGHLRRFTLFECWMLFFNWFSHGNCLWSFRPYGMTPAALFGNPGALLFQTLFFGIFLLGLWPRLRMPDKNDGLQTMQLALYVLSLPVILMVGTMIGLNQIYTERYAFILLPFFLIVIARGATRFTHPRLQKALAVGLIVAGIASYGILLKKDIEWTVYKQNVDWRTATQYLGTKNLTEAMVMVITPADDLLHYLRQIDPAARIYYANEIQSNFSDVGFDTLYLIKNEYWLGNFNQALEQIQRSARFEATEVREFKGVEIHTFKTKS